MEHKPGATLEDKIVAELQRPMGDPTTGEVTVKLSDSVERKLRFDYRALRLAETVFNRPFTEIVVSAITAGQLSAFLWAGMDRDARNRGEASWSVERVDDLVSLEEVPALLLKVQWALKIALKRLNDGAEKTLGEMQASAGLGAGKSS